MDIDAQLLDRYAHNRDAEAFTLLVRRHAGMVFAVARRMTRNHHDAEEVAQNCFLDLARQAESIHGSLAGWLHATATHRASDFNRAANIRRRHEVAAARVRTQGDSPWDEISPLVDAAMAELPDDLRLPLVLFHLEGRNQAEIAAELEIHQSTVSRRLEAAVAALRAKLTDAGVMTPSLALPALLAQHAIEVVPKALMAELGKLAVSGVAPITSGAVSGAASGAASGVAKGAVPLAAKIAAVLVAATAISTIGYRAPRPPIQPVVAVSAGLAGGNTVSDPGALAGPELLKLLELQIKNARAKIKTLDAQINYSTSFASPSGVSTFQGKKITFPNHSDSSVHFIADGDRRFIQHQQNSYQPDSTSPQYFEMRYVLNDSYSAWLPAKNDVVEQRDHQSIASRDQRAIIFEGVSAGINPFCYGFGLGFGTDLDGAHRYDAKMKNTWSVTKKTDEGVPWYEILLHRPDALGKDILVSVIRIDPSKGYLITAVKSYYNGSLAYELTVDAQEVGLNGIWFPTHIAESHFQGTKTIADISQVRINEPIDPAQFQITALGLTPGVMIARTKVDGTQAELICNSKSELVPYKFGDPIPRGRKDHAAKGIAAAAAASVASVTKIAAKSAWWWWPWALAVGVFGAAGVLLIRQRRNQTPASPLRGSQGPRRK